MDTIIVKYFLFMEEKDFFPLEIDIIFSNGTFRHIKKASLNKIIFKCLGFMNANTFLGFPLVKGCFCLVDCDGATEFYIAWRNTKVTLKYKKSSQTINVITKMNIHTTLFLY